MKVQNVSRFVFPDGAEGLAQAALYPERISRFLTALTSQLRHAGVTILLSQELPLFVPMTKLISLSAVVENVLLLRFFERDSKLHRLLSVIKIRDSDFDPSIREFTISGTGIQVHAHGIGIEQVFTASPHAVAPQQSRQDSSAPG